MKKYITCTLFLIILTACAGNPPAWWNPSGRYSNAPQSVPSTPTEVAAHSAPAPAQETLLPVDTDYEEMALSPIAAAEESPTSSDLAPSVLEE